MSGLQTADGKTIVTSGKAHICEIGDGLLYCRAVNSVSDHLDPYFSGQPPDSVFFQRSFTRKCSSLCRRYSR